MKRKIITRAVIIIKLLLVIGFVFTLMACAQQKKVTVSGIPAAHNGKFGFFALRSVDDAVAWSTATIRNSSVSFDLLDVVTDRAWNGGGSYIVVLLIYNTQQDYLNQGNPSYSGVILEHNLTEQKTTFQWSQFMDVSSSEDTNAPKLSLWTRR